MGTLIGVFILATSNPAYDAIFCQLSYGVLLWVIHPLVYHEQLKFGVIGNKFADFFFLPVFLLITAMIITYVAKIKGRLRALL